VSDHLGIGLALELYALAFELLAQLAEIFDDAVMHNGENIGRMRMGIRLARSAVGSSAGVTDSNRSGEWLADKPVLQIPELAFGSPPREPAIFERRNSGRIITSVFEALERFHQLAGNRRATQDSYNAAHSPIQPLAR
jgi:hypothetical protein